MYIGTVLANIPSGYFIYRDKPKLLFIYLMMFLIPTIFLASLQPAEAMGCTVEVLLDPAGWLFSFSGLGIGAFIGWLQDELTTKIKRVKAE